MNKALSSLPNSLLIGFSIKFAINSFFGLHPAFIRPWFYTLVTSLCSDDLGIKSKALFRPSDGPKMNLPLTKWKNLFATLKTEQRTIVPYFLLFNSILKWWSQLNKYSEMWHLWSQFIQRTAEISCFWMWHLWSQFALITVE